MNDVVLLSEATSTRYRAAVARCNYLSADRPDIQYSTKELSRGKSKPSRGHWAKLVHLVRYLAGQRNVVQWFGWQSAPFSIVCFTDSDWAGCRETRKSSSGGGIRMGGHLLKTWSKTQATIATSSGEAELYAAVKGAAELLGLRSLAKGFGRTFGAELRVDAKAAIGMVN